ncbi:hypothetical protein TELCIR_12298 [Teladorsagia circumcincta]|uniref:Uncharacterized protein n=1 Tax=Teladorsagia circumcincta TaxID=45464 RepID=A0A2G9U8G9_TELCI|nr:hypothetical protein TELCIR_12298 [Teladorsagia circumcincta]
MPRSTHICQRIMHDEHTKAIFWHARELGKRLQQLAKAQAQISLHRKVAVIVGKAVVIDVAVLALLIDLVLLVHLARLVAKSVARVP